MARSAQTARIGRAMRETLSKQLADVMLTAADAVEANCPIATGHLISNFVLTVRTPFTGVDGSPEAVSYAAQDAGRAAVLNYDVGRDGKIYLRNNVEYLQYLPPFVTEALQAGVAAMPRGRKTATRKMLKQMARDVFKKGG